MLVSLSTFLCEVNVIKPRLLIYFRWCSLTRCHVESSSLQLPIDHFQKIKRSRVGESGRRLMHLVPAPAVRLMKRRVQSRPGVRQENRVLGRPLDSALACWTRLKVMSRKLPLALSKEKRIKHPLVEGSRFIRDGYWIIFPSRIINLEGPVVFNISSLFFDNIPFLCLVVLGYLCAWRLHPNTRNQAKGMLEV